MNHSTSHGARTERGRMRAPYSRTARRAMLAASLGLYAGPAALAAQFAQPERPTLRDPLAAFLRDARLEMVPTFGMAAGNTEFALSGILSLQSDLRRDTRWTARMAALAVRSPAHTFAGAEIALAGAHRHGPLQSRLEAAVHAGTGSGASPAFSITAASGAGNVTLQFRSTWLQAAPTRNANHPAAPGGADVADPLNEDPFQSRYDEAELTALHRFGRFEASGNAGLRFGEAGESSPPWAALQLAAPVRGNLDVYVAGGSRPERPEIGQRAGSFVMLGLRLRPARSASLGGIAAPAPLPPPEPFATYRLREDAWVLAIHAPDARLVEIASDFTDWESVPLEAAPGEHGIWRETFVIRPGLHHVAIRIDGGEWRAPPGLPAVSDGFGGEVGLLELR